MDGYSNGLSAESDDRAGYNGGSSAGADSSRTVPHISVTLDGLNGHGIKRRTSPDDSAGSGSSKRPRDTTNQPISAPSRGSGSPLDLLANTATLPPQQRRRSLPHLHASHFTPSIPSVYPGTNMLPVPNRSLSPDSPLSLATIASSAARERLVGSLTSLLAEYDSSLIAELASWQGAVRSREQTIRGLNGEVEMLRSEVERLRGLLISKGLDPEQAAVAS
jgi:hypothetical protein